MKEIMITEQQIEEYIFEKLTALGYCPSEDEMYDISDIVFQMLVDFFESEELDDDGE